MRFQFKVRAKAQVLIISNAAKSQLIQNAYPPTHFAVDFYNIYIHCFPPMDTMAKPICGTKLPSS
jgi:hypothetical protein